MLCHSFAKVATLAILPFDQSQESKGAGCSGRDQGECHEVEATKNQLSKGDTGQEVCVSLILA